MFCFETNRSSEEEKVMFVRKLLIKIKPRLSVLIHSSFLLLSPINTRPGNYFKMLCFF